MIIDRLTRAERIRLESLNQSIQHSGATLKPTPPDLEIILRNAERIETWLRQAKEDA